MSQIVGNYEILGLDTTELDSRYVLYRVQETKEKIPGIALFFPFDKIDSTLIGLELRRMVENQWKLKHNNIQAFKDLVRNSDGIYTILQKPKRRFRGLLGNESPMKETTSFPYFKDLFSAIFYMHSCRIAHMNISLDSLYIDSKSCILLGRFYYSVDTRFTPSVLYYPGCINCAPPEAFSGTGFDPIKADIWSTAVTVYQCLTFSNLFDGKTQEEVKEQILNKPIALEEYLSSELHDLLHRMLDRNPITRITAAEILEHPWMHSMRAKLSNSYTRVTYYTFLASKKAKEAIIHSLSRYNVSFQENSDHKISVKISQASTVGLSVTFTMGKRVTEVEITKRNSENQKLYLEVLKSLKDAISGQTDLQALLEVNAVTQQEISSH